MADRDTVDEMDVLLADILDEGIIGHKVDAVIIRYSDDGHPMLQFEDGTTYEVLLRKLP